MVQCKAINMIRFADDMDIVAENETDLNNIMVREEEMMDNGYNMKKNGAKIKVIVCGKEAGSTVEIIMNEETPEDVQDFSY